MPVLGDATVLPAKGLEAPHTLAISASGEELYVADWGKSHQVKVFAPIGVGAFAPHVAVGDHLQG